MQSICFYRVLAEKRNETEIIGCDLARSNTEKARSGDSLARSKDKKARSIGEKAVSKEEFLSLCCLLFAGICIQ